jgi:hypothetical protein
VKCWPKRSLISLRFWKWKAGLSKAEKKLIDVKIGVEKLKDGLEPNWVVDRDLQKNQTMKTKTNQKKIQKQTSG